MNVKSTFNQWAVFVCLVQMVCVLEEEVSHSNFNNIPNLHYSFTIACRGVDAQLLPGDVQRFTGCVIVNGDLIFNFVTYQEFM